MAMPMVGSLHLVNTISVHKAHNRGHGEHTRYQGRQYLPGFGGKHDQHRHCTSIPRLSSGSGLCCLDAAGEKAVNNVDVSCICVKRALRLRPIFSASASLRTTMADYPIPLPSFRWVALALQL